MPTQPDGRLDLAACREWYRQNITPRPRSGGESQPGQLPKAADSQEEHLEVTAPLADESSGGTTAAAVLTAIHAWRDRLPELFLRLGASLRLALVSAEMLDGLLLFGVGDVTKRALGRSCGPLAKAHDLVAIARGLGVSPDELRVVADSAAMQAWSDAISRFFAGERDWADGVQPLTGASQ